MNAGIKQPGSANRVKNREVRYEYSEEDVRKIFRAIDAELRAIKAKFRNSSKSETLINKDYDYLAFEPKYQ